jgi:hypothetical protein
MKKMSKFLKLSLLGFASTVLFSCGTPEAKVETNVDSLAADTLVIDSAIVALDTTVISLDSVQK